jgi:hypothetical protein
VVADSHGFDEEQDPDPHCTGSEKLDLDPHYSDVDPQPWLESVLWNRDKHPGSTTLIPTRVRLFPIPDPNFFIPDPQRI